MSTNPENAHTSETIGAERAQVERWDQDCEPFSITYGNLERVPDGEFVRFTDYESLRAERDRLRAALEGLLGNYHIEHRAFCQGGFPHDRPCDCGLYAAEAAARAALK